MVKPTEFGFNSAAAEDNLFAHHMAQESQSESLALKEWEGLRAKLEACGIQIYSAAVDEVHSPDKVFPNNWFSTHREDQGSKLVLYPLKVANRREERSRQLIASLKSCYDSFWDLSHYEQQAKPEYLEGTGSLVLDRIHKVAYMAISGRSHFRLASKWAAEMGYELYSFTSQVNEPTYHTNVMLSVGSTYAIVCLECIECEHERGRLRQRLMQHHELIEISREQMNHFCGNVLELVGGKGEKLLAMSEQAYLSFSPSQKSTILKHVQNIVWSPVPTIETLGGGGVRCMIAELF
ncbi:MAG: amidinotransferase [Oligoflexales bacterium]|nr:amidinotransferase [Oligoflexales bacterium]